MMRKFLFSICLAASTASLPRAQEAAPKAPTDVQPGSITYEEIAYPHPVHYLPLTLYGQDVRMAYMDVPPWARPTARGDSVPRHEFRRLYFAGPIEMLRKDGFRVVVPIRSASGGRPSRSSRANFHDMALNSRKLLQSLGIAKVAVIGHPWAECSPRAAASYPDMVERPSSATRSADRRALRPSLAHGR
jgi:hypothetical protein